LPGNIFIERKKNMLLLGKGTVITRDARRPIIKHGGVVMEDSVIVEVGDFETLRQQYPEAEHIDAHGGVIHPGLINVHHHIYSALARGLSFDDYVPKDFLDILEGQWFRIDKGLMNRETRASAVATYLACIQYGVTTIFDHHASYGEIEGSLSVIAEEAKRFGVRSCLCYEVSDRNGREEMEKAVSENLRFAQEAKKDPDHLAAMMGLHASFTLSETTLDYVVNENIDHLGYHVHVAEGVADLEDSLSKYGLRTVERLYKKGILGEKTLAGHCIHIDDDEIKRLAETNTMVVFNPESNMGNAVGAPDVLKLYYSSVLLGLGTDGYTSDMFESYKVANCLVKHQSQDPNAGWGEVPDMLFNQNRKIAERHFDLMLGVLKPGAVADVIVIDYDEPTPMNASNMNAHLLFGVNGSDVVTTISDGVVRMKDRKIQGMNKKNLLAEVRAEADSFWKRLKGENEEK
jgi:putative selenium metabolism protein SsnA